MTGELTISLPLACNSQKSRLGRGAHGMISNFGLCLVGLDPIRPKSLIGCILLPMPHIRWQLRRPQQSLFGGALGL